MAKNRTLDSVLADLPAARRARIGRRGKALIAQEFTLRRLREARLLTQQELAAASGKAQANIVRLEKQSDLLISTLRAHVEAMGGTLELRVQFPDTEPMILAQFAEDADVRPARSQKKPPRRATRGNS